MKYWKQLFGALLVALPASYALAGGGGNRAFEVTITNITLGEIFTPVMVATHGRHVKLFSEGMQASPELEMLAEGGDTAPLSNKLLDDGALDVVTTDGVLPPGHSVTVQVRTNRWNDHVSVAAMLVPTNDAFIAINGVQGPRPYRSKTIMSPAYDAGTELNDELCVSIPGPTCGGEPFSEGQAEGFVFVHAGIHGNGDLSNAVYNWHNPVARVAVKRID